MLIRSGLSPLPAEYSAPLRLRLENQLGYKMVKWIERIEFVASEKVLGEGKAGSMKITSTSTRSQTSRVATYSGTRACSPNCPAIRALLRVNYPLAGATTMIVSLSILAKHEYLVIIEIAVVLLAAQAFVINRLAGLQYPIWRRHPPRTGGPQ